MKGGVAALLDLAQNQGQKTIQLGLERVVRLLDALGNPHHGLEVVHVAGTNGKGSVIAFLDAILRQSGIRTGVFSSPHLQRFNERIQIDGQAIEDEELGPPLIAALAANKNGNATFFELTTAAALYHFKRRGFGPKKGLLLLETGLGGRLDATNVLASRLCAITPIAMDHADFLGNTIPKIAYEKAGILKPGVTAVADPGQPPAVQTVLHQAQQVGSPVILRGRDYDYAPPSDPRGIWRFFLGTRELTLPAPGLAGRHQYGNAAQAVALSLHLQTMGWSVSTPAIGPALASTRWPGRLERFSGSPTILLDGAHNPRAVSSLAAALEDGTAPGDPNLLIFSTMANKDAQTMARILAPSIQQVWTVQTGGSRGLAAEALAGLWEPLQRSAQPCRTVEEALSAALATCPASGQIVVAGSLYLVGAVRALIADSSG